MNRVHRKRLHKDELIGPNDILSNALPEIYTLANKSRTFFSDSPTYILMSSGPLTLRKFKEHSVATALAINVLPVPGGPYNNTPVTQNYFFFIFLFEK